VVTDGWFAAAGILAAGTTCVFNALPAHLLARRAAPGPIGWHMRAMRV
jgi:hypothetical protein